MDLAPAGFTGFGPGLPAFFRGLAENQNRNWFLEHKPLYEAQIREPLARLVGSLTFAFLAHDLPLRGDPKTSMFRINRDVRFSKDKRPYKTNASAVWTRDGTKHTQGLFYFQVGVEGAMAACGFYGPEPDQQQAIRTAIASRPDHWLDVEATLARHGLPLSREHALSRLPRGFDADATARVAHAIKCTSWVVGRPIDIDEAMRPELVDRLAAIALSAMPLLSFGWNALATLPPRRT